MDFKTKRLTTGGVLIALGIVLSLIKVYELPYGGSITAAGMVPVILLGYMYGMKWGLGAGFVFSVIQAILGATASQAFAGMFDKAHPALSVVKIIAMALLDYIIAFSVLGLSSLFKNKIKNDKVALTLGGAGVIGLRFLAHFASGWILWGSYAEWFFSEQMNNTFGKNILAHFNGQALAAIYSLIYNGSYMLPELIISVVVLIILTSVKPLQQQIFGETA